MNSSWWMGSLNNYNKYAVSQNEFKEYTECGDSFSEPPSKTLVQIQQERIEELEAKLRKFNLLTGRIKDGS